MIKQNSSSCQYCNGFYSSTNEHPVCCTCHAFLYDYATEGRLNNMMSSNLKEASNDSGTEEPDNALPLHNSYSQRDHQSHAVSVPLPTTLLTNNSVSKEHSPLEILPTEVLLRIFRYLDDLTLWFLRLCTPRFLSIIDRDVSEERWAEFVNFRWPIFVPRCRISSWRMLYLNMMESVTCHICLSRLLSPAANSLFPNIDEPSVRFRRIISEIRSLCADPPYGIKALPLDTDTFAHCLAVIAGPPASPYEGGLFHVHIRIPDSHPMRPPVIRFLTRILHPNISSHGDIGLDCIRHNWSLALTLDKLLVSIQSLLTDPYTIVCMEPAIGRLYNRDRDKFEELARLWTWKYACHDYLSAAFVSQLVLPDYIN